MSKEAIIKLVFGVRGCGKTEKIRKLVKDCRRLLIIDTLGGDYSDGVVFHSLEKLQTFWRSVYTGNFRLIYKPPGGDEETVEDIAALCALTTACENMTIAIEELNILFDSKRPPTEFNHMIFGGRKPGIELIGAAQRPYGFGRKITSQAKEFYIFHTHEPDDIAFFKKTFGADAANAIKELKLYEYLKWHYGKDGSGWDVFKDEL